MQVKKLFKAMATWLRKAKANTFMGCPRHPIGILEANRCQFNLLAREFRCKVSSSGLLGRRFHQHGGVRETRSLAQASVLDQPLAS